MPRTRLGAIAFLTAILPGIATAASHITQPATLASPTVYAAWSQITGTTAAQTTTPSGYADLNISMRFIMPGRQPCPDFAVNAVTNGSASVQPVNWTPRPHAFPDPFDPQHKQMDIFDITVCAAPMPDGWQKADLIASTSDTTPVLISDTKNTPSVPVVFAGAADVGRAGPPNFVALGDTGCRGQTGSRGFQSCDNSNPEQTKFLFSKVGQEAAAANPEFIIHVGDYRYDKEPSIPQQQRWANWQVDFFDQVRLQSDPQTGQPMTGLLGRVPWAFARGNHEACSYASQSFFFFFGTPASDHVCQPPARPGDNYQAELAPVWWFDVTDRSNAAANPHRFVMIDTSARLKHDHAARDLARARFKDAIRAAHAPGWATGQPSAWFAMHKPLWAVDDYNGEQADSRFGDAFRDAVSALGNEIDLTGCVAPYLPAQCGLKAVLAGHLHITQNVVTVDGALPQQIIIGSSGIKLDPAVAEGCKFDLDSLGLHGRHRWGVAALSQGAQFPAGGPQIDNKRFAYLHFDRDAGSDQPGWTGTAHFIGQPDKSIIGYASLPAPGHITCR